MNPFSSKLFWPCLGLAFVLFACSPEDSSRLGPDGGWLHLDLGRRASNELISYYAGGMLSPPSDPFAAGLVAQRGSRFYLNLDSLSAIDYVVAERLRTAASGESGIGWDDFATFLEDVYPRLRQQPATATELFNRIGYAGPDDPEWMIVEVTGVMSTMRRRVAVQRSLVVGAISRYEAAGDALVYAEGTAFVAEHLEDSLVREVTVMVKREDGYWDFFAYGPDGSPASETAAKPRPLRVPTQCVGCHFGSKLYEPEKSFPANAADGPHGPRVLHVDDRMRNTDVVQFFDEHRKRSDHVLGLYATLYLSRLLSDGSDLSADSLKVDLEFLPPELRPG
ncbi:MAG: hypothetical protein KJO98_09040 [Rhodothermia bacterium]|nr:hypothetical protein [Rhodothermia bacterium]